MVKTGRVIPCCKARYEVTCPKCDTLISASLPHDYTWCGGHDVGIKCPKCKKWVQLPYWKVRRRVITEEVTFDSEEEP